jgi:hypothetical protein
MCWPIALMTGALPARARRLHGQCNAEQSAHRPRFCSAASLAWKTIGGPTGRKGRDVASALLCRCMWVWQDAWSSQWHVQMVCMTGWGPPGGLALPVASHGAQWAAIIPIRRRPRPPWQCRPATVAVRPAAA